MKIALDVVAGFYTFIAFGSASGKLTKNRQVLASLRGVGVKDSQVPLLAVLEILGGLGLVAGIWSKGLGVAAALCLALYFVGAVLAHVRAKDPVAAMVPPIVLTLIGAATTILELRR